MQHCMTSTVGKMLYKNSLAFYIYYLAMLFFMLWYNYKLNFKKVKPTISCVFCQLILLLLHIFEACSNYF